jgi:diguanylate cyclase (GGDEF)-like protein
VNDRIDSTLRKLASVVVPEGLILLAVIVLLQFDSVREPLSALARYYPYAIIAIGLLLAWRFGQSQILFSLLVLVLVERTLAFTASGDRADDVFQVLAFLLPLNLVTFARLKEHSLLTPSSAIRAGAILAQAMLVFVFVRMDSVTAVLETQDGLPAWLFSWTPIGSIGLVTFGGVITLLVVRQALDPTAAGRGFLWALLAAFIALNTTGDTRTIYFATAGLILVVAVIETSYSMAFRDGLTGLPSRRALDEALTRIGGKYAVAMVDVDNFKRLNDSYGHDTGDQVLCMVAAKLSKVSGGGRTFRYGGEEFAILFPRMTVDDTLLFLEVTRQEIEDTRFKLRGADRPKKTPKEPKRTGRRGKRISVTVSMGVAEPTKKNWTPLEVIEAADAAMYRAKQRGRNRIES